MRIFEKIYQMKNQKLKIKKSKNKVKFQMNKYRKIKILIIKNVKLQRKNINNQNRKYNPKKNPSKKKE